MEGTLSLGIDRMFWLTNVTTATVTALVTLLVLNLSAVESTADHDIRTFRVREGCGRR